MDPRGIASEKDLACLTDAQAAGRTAIASWIVRTTEGDPIPYFARATADGVWVAWTSAYDTYGRGGWVESTCPAVAALPRCAG